MSRVSTLLARRRVSAVIPPAVSTDVGHSQLPSQLADMRTTLYNERAGSTVASSPLRTALNRPSRDGASAAPRSSATTVAQRKAAQRKAEHVRDTQTQHLEGDDEDEDGGDQSAWPSWKEQPMPKQRAAQVSTRQPTQLSSFSEARAEVVRGRKGGDEPTTKHAKEADNLARIDRKIEATLRPAPPEEGSGSRPPVRQPRVALAAQATSPGGEREVDMGRPDVAGQQPLVYAAYHGDVEAAFSLLDQPGTDANCRDAGGRTVLMIAACAGHGDLVRLLLQHGADTDAKDFASGHTALQMAKQRGQQDVVEALDPVAAAAAEAARSGRARGASYGPPSDDEEARYVPPPPLVPGQLVVLDHRIRLDTTLTAFNWEDYEHALGRRASPTPTPTPTPSPSPSPAPTYRKACLASTSAALLSCTGGSVWSTSRAWCVWCV